MRGVSYDRLCMQMARNRPRCLQYVILHTPYLTRFYVTHITTHRYRNDENRYFRQLPDSMWPDSIWSEWVLVRTERFLRLIELYTQKVGNLGSASLKPASIDSALQMVSFVDIQRPSSRWECTQSKIVFCSSRWRGIGQLCMFREDGWLKARSLILIKFLHQPRIWEGQH